MKKSKVETAETRRRIVETAARKIQRNGIDGTGVAEIMVAAGLTRGGFYRHFESKEQLVAEACTAGLGAIVARAEDAAAEKRDGDGLGAIIANYLALDHRDDRFSGCPLAGLGSELARADKETRSAATAGLSRLVELIARQTRHRKPEVARSEALFALSAMVGAVTLSRIASDPGLSDAILEETKKHLGQSTGNRPGRRGRFGPNVPRAASGPSGTKELQPASQYSAAAGSLSV